MKYKYFGTTGMQVSEFCLGTQTFGWTANEETSHKIMDMAWDRGINFFDTADVYYVWSEKSYGGKTEEIIGRWLEKSGIRDELILATKVRGAMIEDGKPNSEGLSRRHIMKSIEGSLKRLKTSWIDLYQAHWPDDDVPIFETLKTFTELIESKKVMHIGASVYNPWKLMEALWIADKYELAKYQSIQHYYSLARRHLIEKGLLEVADKYNLATLTFSPLSEGFLTGKYRKGKKLQNPERGQYIKPLFFNERGFKILETLEEITNEKDVSIAQGALAWVLHQSITCPIIGVSTIEQFEENLGALEITFTQDELKRLDEVSNPKTNMIIR